MPATPADRRVLAQSLPPLRDADAAMIAKTDAYRALAADAGFKQLVTSGDFQRFFASADNAKLVTGDLARLVTGNPDALRMLGSDALRSSVTQVPDFAKVTTDANLLAVASSGDGQMVLRAPEFARVLEAGPDGLRALLPTP